MGSLDVYNNFGSTGDEIKSSASYLVKVINAGIRTSLYDGDAVSVQFTKLLRVPGLTHVFRIIFAITLVLKRWCVWLCGDLCSRIIFLFLPDCQSQYLSVGPICRTTMDPVDHRWYHRRQVQECWCFVLCPHISVNITFSLFIYLFKTQPLFVVEPDTKYLRTLSETCQ